MSTTEDTVKLSVRVHPRAAKNEVVGLTKDVWQIRLTAPPIKGKANNELLDFLSQLLGIAKSRVDIIKGHTTKNKLLAIRGLSQEVIMSRLAPNYNSPRPFSSCDNATGKYQARFPRWE